MSPAMTYSAPPRWRSCDGVQCRYRWQVLRKALPDGKSRARETASADRSEVRVTGPGHNNALVYQSTDRSILSRAVATDHHH